MSARLTLRSRRLTALLLAIMSLTVVATPPHAAGDFAGHVVDASGAAVPGAEVALVTEANVEFRRIKTDAAGGFVFRQIPSGGYTLTAWKSGFKRLRYVVRIEAGQSTSDVLTLTTADVLEAVTVTPVRGEMRQVFETPEQVGVADADDLLRRPFIILPQALHEEPGVHVQQTTSSQGSPFVRGLTGQQVVALINGVRFSNATARPGANQYTAFIEPTAADRIEVVHGPNSTQYGSDSLGGTINVVTQPVPTSNGRAVWHGALSSFFGSADLAAGGSAQVSGGERRWGIVADAGGRRVQDLRTGGGLDSHSVVTRLLGISSRVLGNRLQDTGYSQFGGHAKLVLHPTSAQTFTVEYLRSLQTGVRRYDQLNGGLGNLLNRFDPQSLDFLIARFDRAGLGRLDSVSAIFSYNGQRDDRTSQSINNKTGLFSKITDEYNRTNAFGYQAQASSHIGRRHSLAFGGELFDEFIASRRQELSYNQTAKSFTDVATVRARFPNGARYRTLGLFAQDIVSLIPEHLRGTFGLRYSRYTYLQTPDQNPLDAKGEPLVPRFQTGFGDMTFNAGLVYSLNPHLNLTVNVSRGFRAPNVNDFGSIGISGLGFEVSPEEGERLGGATSVSGQAGRPSPVRPLKAEQLLNYEAGFKARSAWLSGGVAVFDSEMTDFIERRTLLLPAGAVGKLVGGQPITRQDETGAIYTSLSSSSVFVRANGSHIRLRGFEASFALKLRRDLSVNANTAYVRGTDLGTGRAPNLENGVPPTHGFAGLRWEPTGRRFWAEAYSGYAFAQRRFSDNDLGQARIGGIRTQDEIANFFNNGATARGLVSGGVLLATRETLAAVQMRVLGPDPKARTPLYTKNPGFTTFNLRGGYRLGERSSFIFIAENLFDKNYRLMGSGVDAPGINLMVRYTVRF